MHSSLIVGMTILFSNFLRTCIVQAQCVRIYFACTTRLFQSLGRSVYQGPQCVSKCHVRNIPFEQQTNSFPLKFSQGIFISPETQKPIQDAIRDVYCPTCPNKKCVYISTNKTSSFHDCKEYKACCHVLNIHFQDQNRQICCLAAMAYIALSKRRVVATKKRNHFLL